MTFPTDKETWTPKVGKDLSLGVLGDVLEASDFNDYADFLERLQDTLGLDIIGDFASVKLRLDDTATLASTMVAMQLIQGKL